MARTTSDDLNVEAEVLMTEAQQAHVDRFAKLLAAEQRIARLEAALAPFARIAEQYDIVDVGEPWQDDEEHGDEITVGDLRRAREALKP